MPALLAREAGYVVQNWQPDLSVKVGVASLAVVGEALDNDAVLRHPLDGRNEPSQAGRQPDSPPAAFAAFRERGSEDAGHRSAAQRRTSLGVRRSAAPCTVLPAPSPRANVPIRRCGGRR